MKLFIHLSDRVRLSLDEEKCNEMLFHVELEVMTLTTKMDY